MSLPRSGCARHACFCTSAPRYLTCYAPALTHAVWTAVFPAFRPALSLTHSRQEVRDVFDAPLLELVFAAARVHRMYHDPRQVRVGRRRETRLKRWNRESQQPGSDVALAFLGGSSPVFGDAQLTVLTRVYASCDRLRCSSAR